MCKFSFGTFISVCLSELLSAFSFYFMHSWSTNWTWGFLATDIGTGMDLLVAFRVLILMVLWPRYT